jgi:chloride channel, nucleotide-sensitive, 1A
VLVIFTNLYNSNDFYYESKLYFYSQNTSTGLAIDYPTIIIHAISRQQALDDTGPCIYTQLNEKLNVFTAFDRTSAQHQPSASTASQEDEREDDEDYTTELKFIPDDIGARKSAIVPLVYCLNINE